MKKLLILLLILMSDPSVLKAETILSYNVYFDDRSGSQRYSKIIGYISHSSPDIVCLQECTRRFIKKLEESSLKDVYNFYHTRQHRPYFNIILSKIKAENHNIVQLPSKMNRVAPYINIKIKDIPVRVYSIHLESLDLDSSLNLRKSQIEVLKKDMGKKPSILAGDFNFGDSGVEEKYLPIGIKDWGKQGIVTYDPETNPIAAETASHGEKARRLDRVFSLNLKGSTKLKIKRVFHSDHYPITGTIKINDQ